jgi:hypothetical protein
LGSRSAGSVMNCQVFMEVVVCVYKIVGKAHSKQFVACFHLVWLIQLFPCKLMCICFIHILPFQFIFIVLFWLSSSEIVKCDFHYVLLQSHITVQFLFYASCFQIVHTQTYRRACHVFCNLWVYIQIWEKTITDCLQV